MITNNFNEFYTFLCYFVSSVPPWFISISKRVIITFMQQIQIRYSFSEINKHFIVPLVFLVKEQPIEVLQYFYYY
jgi:5-hydroxyisourate hydrolase-like protein (transthyretin family)